jgi:hypothetical protein
MPESDRPVEDPLAHYQLEIDRLKNALALLGVNACSWCKRFFRSTDPGALFDAGELICYGCILEWWTQRSAQLSSKERENLEGKLVFWLRDFHHAELFKDPAKLPDPAVRELNIVANCLECHGTGKSLGGEHCRFCEDRGTVWVVVWRRQA